MTRMYNPPQRGETLCEDMPTALVVSITQAAKQFAVARSSFAHPERAYRHLAGDSAAPRTVARRRERWQRGRQCGRYRDDGFDYCLVSSNSHFIH